MRTRSYQAWLKKTKGSDLITGIPAADRGSPWSMSSASVVMSHDRYRSCREGINLQFCSMLANYDLPWNPQRVEQRIGCVHCFGQKHNVIVVNFSNKGNVVVERIPKLLTEKFKLSPLARGLLSKSPARLKTA